MNKHLKDRKTTRDIKEIRVNGARENNAFKKNDSNNTMGCILGVKTSRISLIGDKILLPQNVVLPYVCYAPIKYLESFVSTLLYCNTNKIIK